MVIIALLVFLAIVSIIILIVLSSYSSDSNGTPPSSKNACYVPQSQLVDLSQEQCCIYGTQNTGWRRYGENTVSPSATPALIACGSFCNSISGTSCSSDTPAQQREKFNLCMSNIAPRGCNGLAYPVGRVGTKNYYITSYLASTCNSWTDCS